MNCQRFENVVSELARGQMMAAEQRGEALAHSETCENCAARLRDEEMLTRGLQSLAARWNRWCAGCVETKLLEAFRNRHVLLRREQAIELALLVGGSCGDFVDCD